MAKFVNAERLKLAIDRLRQSRASAGMVNFLILKRSVTLSKGVAIALSTKDTNFQQAITDLTWWPEDKESEEERPFLDVFGSIKNNDKGLKKQKYRSNGPADTLKNGNWNPVVLVGTGAKSKTAKLQTNYLDGLQELTLLKDTSRPMPRLEDAAVWYYRGQDITGVIGRSDDDEEIEQKLSAAFCKEVGLTADDLAILFASEEEEEDAEEDDDAE